MARREKAPQSPPAKAGSRLVLRPLPKRGFFLKSILVLWGLFIVALGTAVGGSLYLYRKYSGDLPELPRVEDYRPPIISEFWSNDRVMAGEFYDERRRVLPYDEIPTKLIQAFVAAEDKRFFDHRGFDPIGTVRAAVNNFKGGRMQGGSSLTQQTAKAILVSSESSKITEEQVQVEAKRALEPIGLADNPDAVRAAAIEVRERLQREAHARGTKKNMARKIRELILAIRLEEALNKEQILYLYLNNVYLGHHSYGVGAAAENYFRKDIHDLTLGEMAYLAALPQAPTKYSPWANPANARNRRGYVLARMREEGMITEEERQVALAENTPVYDIDDRFHEFAPFYTEQGRRDIVARYGNGRLLNDGLQVVLAMDAERQRAAQAAMLDGLMTVDKRQGYAGPLMHLEKPAERAAFVKKIAARLGREQLAEGSYYVGLVETIDNAGTVAGLDIGGQKAKLPVSAMRWAREVNPEQSYLAHQVGNIKRVLKVGDVIVVKCVSRAELAKGGRSLPKEGPFVKLEQVPQIQGAIVSIDPEKRYLAAMVGGYDFDASEFNRAYQGCRQPGSSFKPIVYSGAMELLGWQPWHMLIDEPVAFGGYRPHNFGGGWHGPTTMRTALVRSMNIPAIKTLDALGVEAGATWAHQLGITTPIDLGLAMALGSSCVIPADLVSVYATIDQGGIKVRPTLIRQVTDRNGRVLEDHTAYDDPMATFVDRVSAGYAKMTNAEERVMSPETAFMITYLMREVVLRGTGAPAGALGKPAAGKTGTTNDSYDTWFLGFTRGLVAGVWLGYDKNQYSLGVFETGGHASLPIWVDYMRRALGKRPEKEFAPPPDANIAWTSEPEYGLKVPYVPGKDIHAWGGGGGKGGGSASAGEAADPDAFMEGL